MLKIAVIVPLYNGSRFIEEALESIFSQSRQADEIIVVDDGSTDSGPDIVRAFAEKHATLRLLQKKNGGQSSARNLGAAHTSCDLIALLDQDDYWYNNHLAVLEHAFINGPANLGYVYSNSDRVNENGKYVSYSFLNKLGHQEHPKRTLRACLERDMYVVPGASLISRKTFLAVGGFDERLSGYEDDDLFMRIFLAGYGALYVDQPLLVWRDNLGSTSYSLKMRYSREIFFDKLLSGAVLKNQRTLRAVASYRFARAASGDIKDAIIRNDIRALQLGLQQAMKFSREMTPLERIALQFKVQRRAAAFKAKSKIREWIGLREPANELPIAPQ